MPLTALYERVSEIHDIALEFQRQEPGIVLEPEVPAHEHHHDHCHDDEEIVSKSLGYATVGANWGVAGAQFALGKLASWSLVGDALHNIGDGGVYGLQFFCARNRNRLSEKTQNRLRKVGHWVIAAGSAFTAAKAGAALGFDYETEPEPYAIYAAAASVALNSLLFARLHHVLSRKIKQNPDYALNAHEKDLKKHFLAVDMPSALLALGGVAIQRYNVDIEQVAGVASGVFGLWAFRPTKKNLAHEH